MNKTTIYIYTIFIVGIILIFGCSIGQSPKQNTELDKYKNSLLEFTVIDAKTNEPIKSANLSFYNILPCKNINPLESMFCGRKLIAKGKTDELGKLKIKFDEFPLEVIISVSGYFELHTFVYVDIEKSRYKIAPQNFILLKLYENKGDFENEDIYDRAEVIQTRFGLINKNDILLYTKEKAIEFSKKDTSVSVWLNNHNASAWTPTMIVNNFNLYWNVRYYDESCAIKGIPYPESTNSEITCEIGVDVDGFNGNILYIKNQGGEVIHNPK